MATEICWFLKKLDASAYTERWPYGPGDPVFHPDLAIELGADARAEHRVLAVISGSLTVIPLTDETCGLFLMPGHDTNKKLGDGIGEFAFYLRTVLVEDLVEQMRDRIAALKRPRKLSLDDQIAKFKAGLQPVNVRCGEELAKLASEAGTGRGLAQFEAIFAPQRGSHVGKDRGLTYARRLIDPARRFRRMDPVSFYYAVKRGEAAGVQILLDHADHPLWTLPTIRGLLELREERDQTFATDIRLVSPTYEQVDLRHEDWAHRVAVPSGNIDEQAVIVLHKDSHRLCFLPTDSSSGASIRIDEKLPFHVALQSIYMAKTEDAASWFRQPTDPMEFFTEDNTVAPLIDGPALFLEQKLAMERVNAAGQFIWHAGWWCDDSFALEYERKPDGRPDLTKPVAGTTLLDMFTNAATAGAQVRLIAWQQNPYIRLRGLPNSATAAHAQSLPNGNGKSILDGQTKLYGSHHQKFTVVYRNPDDAVAFCGGIDVNPNRLDTDEHKVAEPYHDVHAMLRGPVVHEFMKLYLERWNKHNQVRLYYLRPKLPPPPEVNPPDGGSCFVQVTRTMPEGTHEGIILGIQDSAEALKRAIARAKRYIYIEDQYLFPYWGHSDVPFDISMDPGGIVNALIEALNRDGFEYLLIMIPGHVSVGQGRYRRREFLETLRRAAGPNASKIHVYYLRTPPASKAAIARKTSLIDEYEADLMGGDPTDADDLPDDVEQAMAEMQPSGGDHYPGEIYVHTKVWIVDDVFVKCGSMNCNVRGFTYDSEADFNAVDGAVVRGKRRLALKFRKELWAHHHPGKTARDVPDDITDALSWWKSNVGDKTRVQPYDTTPDTVPPGRSLARSDKRWKKYFDPDGSAVIV